MSSTEDDDITLLRTLYLRYKLTKTTEEDKTEVVFGTFGCLFEVTDTCLYYALSAADLRHYPCVDHLSSESAKVTLLDAKTEFVTTVTHILHFGSGLNIIAILLPKNITQSVLRDPNKISWTDFEKHTLGARQKAVVHTEKELRAEIVSISFEIKYGEKTFKNLFSIQILDLEREFEIPNGTLITLCGQLPENLVGCGLIWGPIRDTAGVSNPSSTYSAINLYKNINALKQVLIQGMTTMVQRNYITCDTGGEGVEESMTCGQEARKKVEIHRFSGNNGFEKDMDAAKLVECGLQNNMSLNVIQNENFNTEENGNIPFTTKRVYNACHNICEGQQWVEKIILDINDTKSQEETDTKLNKHEVENPYPISGEDMKLSHSQMLRIVQLEVSCPSQELLDDSSLGEGYDEVDGIGRSILLTDQMECQLNGAAENLHSTNFEHSSDQNQLHGFKMPNRSCLNHESSTGEPNADMSSSPEEHSQEMPFTDFTDVKSMTTKHDSDQNEIVKNGSGKPTSPSGDKSRTNQNSTAIQFSTLELSVNETNDAIDGDDVTQSLNSTMDDLPEIQPDDNIQPIPNITTMQEDSNKSNGKENHNPKIKECEAPVGHDQMKMNAIAERSHPEQSNENTVIAETSHIQQIIEDIDIAQSAAESHPRQHSERSTRPESNILRPQAGVPARRIKPSGKNIKVENISDGRVIRSFTIGKGGGKCLLEKSGVALVVPENAVDRDTKIFFGLSKNGNDIPPEGPDGGYMYGPLIVCGPHGLKFNVPVYLVFQHSIFFPSDNILTVPEFHKSETCLFEKSAWRPFGGKVMVSRRHAVAVLDGFTKYVWRSTPGQLYRLLRIMIFKETFKDNPERLKITVYPIDAEDGEEQYVRASAKGEVAENEGFLFSEDCSSSLRVQLISGRNCDLMSRDVMEVEFEDIISNRQGLRNHCTFTLQTKSGGPFQFRAVVSQSHGQTTDIEVTDISVQRPANRDSGRYSFDESSLPQKTENTSTKANRDGVNSIILNLNNKLPDPSYFEISETLKDLKMENQGTQNNNTHDQSEATCSTPTLANCPMMPNYSHNETESSQLSGKPTSTSASLQREPALEEPGATGGSLFTPRGPPSSCKWKTNDQFEEGSIEQMEQTVADMVPSEAVTQWSLPSDLREDIVNELDRNETLRGHLMSRVNGLDPREGTSSTWTSRGLLYYIEFIYSHQKFELVSLFERLNLAHISEKLKIYT